MGSCDKRNDNMKRNDSDHEYEYDEYKVKDMGSGDKRNDNIVVLYCTYMHPYIYTVSRTTVQLLHRM